MPSAIDYATHLQTLLEDNSLIIDAWLDNPDDPRELHIKHKKSFDLYHCKLFWPLACLKMTFHSSGSQATKP